MCDGYNAVFINPLVIKELLPYNLKKWLTPVFFAVLDDRVTVRCVSLTAHVRVSSCHTAGHRIALRKHKILD